MAWRPAAVLPQRAWAVVRARPSTLRHSALRRNASSPGHGDSAAKTPRTGAKTTSTSSSSESQRTAGPQGQNGGGITVADATSNQRAVSTNVKKGAGHVALAGWSTGAAVVVEAAEKTFYGGIVLAGAAALGIMGYVVYNQLLSSDGPYRLFNRTADLLQNNASVVAKFGSPVKVTSGVNGLIRRIERELWRRWRDGARFSYQKVEVKGKPGMIMRMAVRGPLASGVGWASFVEDSAGRFKCESLYVNYVSGGRDQTLVLVSDGQVY